MRSEYKCDCVDGKSGEQVGCGGNRITLYTIERMQQLASFDVYRCYEEG